MHCRSQHCWEVWANNVASGRLHGTLEAKYFDTELSSELGVGHFWTVRNIPVESEVVKVTI